MPVLLEKLGLLQGPRHQAEEHFADAAYRSFRKVKVSADGRGVVSHAGIGLLREMAEQTGLVQGVTER